MRFLLFLSLLPFILPAQTLSIYSGNGQIVTEQFLSAPFVARATDSSGQPMSGVAVTWSIPDRSGTLENVTSTTDSNGLASTIFLATTLPTGQSFAGSTITATAASSSISFFVTTSIGFGQNGAPPLVQTLTPAPGAIVTGPAGGIIPGAIKIQVTAQSGFMAGQPIPNVGVRIPPPSDPAQPSASCNGPSGTVLTGSNGVATCDVVLGQQTGSTPLSALIGEIQFTPVFTLTVTPAIACSYTLSPVTQSFSASAGGGVVNIVAGSSCGWTATASGSFISITSPTTGVGNGSVTYSVTANSGVTRAGTITIGGQTLTISQAGVSGPAPLTITTNGSLPQASAGLAYGSALAATGGTPPYQWTASGTLPPGLTLNASNGLISGTPTTPGTFPFAVTVTDAAKLTASQSFTLTVSPSGTGLLITITGFPAGVIGQPYSQALSSTSGCSTPFTPVPVFRLESGTLPPGLVVQSTSNSYAIAGTPTTAGSYGFTLSVQDACGAKASGDFTINVTATAGPSMTASPAALTFTMPPGGTPPASQTLQLTSTTPVAYTATTATTSGGNWLSVANATGTTPGSVTINVVDSAQLAAGTYNGTISITSSAANSPVVVPVTLSVAVPAALSINPLNLGATLPNSGNTLTQENIVFSSGNVPVPFVASATTATGGSWLFVSPTSGSSPATLTATLNANGLAAGSYQGTITLITAYGNETVAVVLTVTAPSSLLATPGTLSFQPGPNTVPPAQTLVVNASDVAASVTAAVSTTAGGNWLSVTPTTGGTPLSLTVSADPTGLAAGSYAGLVSVKASDPTIASANIPVTLTVAPATPSLASITNAGSFAPGPVSPGEIVTLFGTLLGPATLVTSRLDHTGLLSTSLADTEVLFDNFTAPLIYTSAGQVAAIVPYEIAGNLNTLVKVIYQGLFSNVVNLRVVDATPAIFTLTASGQGAIVNQDGSINSSENGAEPGSIVSIYATGAGQTKPRGIDGQITSPTDLSLPVLQPVRVQIGGSDTSVQYAGTAPGLAAGMLQINATVPANAPHGADLQVVLIVGTEISPPVHMFVR